MFTSFRALERHTLRTPGQDLNLVDIVFAPETGQITHVIGQKSRLLPGPETLIRADRLHAVGEEPGVWRVDVSDDELEAARNADATDAVADGSSDTAMGDLPLIIVGPFGYTYSPLMLATQWLSTTPTEATVPPSLERLGDWIGDELFGPAGLIGEVSDFQLEITPERRTVTRITVTSGDAVHGVPLHAIRNRVRSEGYAVTDLTEEDLRNGIDSALPGPSAEPPRNIWVAAA